ncbi:uncharacterized protein EI90DRAFT_3030613 [Cantharellus anzutake]|uniref:uncharacterized protein n=1 Tax=Cantharellus anzutake TaxID=1750568 RepID=UPI001908D6C3|nr:uncharacterized protein EI90DRAFT_3030613 [Cantharellus anzutake]KAF8342900.1 hypothetical protein EI90DRAFT_3030613 [Cantharellus anzutake]
MVGTTWTTTTRRLQHAMFKENRMPVAKEDEEVSLMDVCGINSRYYARSSIIANSLPIQSPFIFLPPHPPFPNSRICHPTQPMVLSSPAS